MRLTIDVALGERAYPIEIGPSLISALGTLTASLGGRRDIALVTDETVAALHLERARASLETSGRTVHPIILPPGEGTKSWSHLEWLVEALLALKVERDDHVIALGGGVIGDLVGFATGITRRGIDFVQVPTTLLSQVDSSVGGKTAIDTAAGKNLVGLFHQPKLVLIDPDLLGTLPDRDFRAGYAELVKVGLIGDANFFDWCDTNLARLLGRDPQTLTQAIETAVRFKAAIVVDDEFETKGRRALLNLGHTFGHALEMETGFSDALLHGEAVAIGMALAFRLSAELGLCPPADADRVARHLMASGLPTHSPDGTAASLTAHMMQDKKMTGGRLAFILARGIGQAFVSRDVDLKTVEAFLDRQLSFPQTRTVS